MWPLLVSIANAEPLPEGECRCFSGQAVGNDTFEVTGRLCRTDDLVTGRIDWTGAAAGVSASEVSGTVQSEVILLRDEALPVAQPKDGWRLCAIDRYLLAPTPSGGLTGTTVSAACADESTLELEPTRCAVQGPSPARVPPEVEACRKRGYLWLSDPDAFERTEIETAGGWTPVWQVQDRHDGRLGRILVYPQSCRVVVRIEAPDRRSAQLVPPSGSSATAAEVRMLERWSLATPN